MSPGSPPRARGDLEIVVITGLSGSGKTHVVRAFEDMGYYCIDNLPVALFPVFADLCVRSRRDIDRAALVVDVRAGASLREFPAIYENLRKGRGRRVRLLYLEADDETLIRRFSETRRPHPLASQGGLEKGIRNEREALRTLRELADLIIDSSSFNVHEMRRYIREHFAAAGDAQPVGITIVSFGYKYGIPTESDLLFDTRFLPNPFFEQQLRNKTGLDPEVASYLEGFPDYRDIKSRITELLDFLIPRYIREGKSYLTVAIGCTGGHHRSVALAEAVAGSLRERGFSVQAAHRDLDRE